jgi:hypothetical protein
MQRFTSYALYTRQKIKTKNKKEHGISHALFVPLLNQPPILALPCVLVMPFNKGNGFSGC